MLIIFVFYGVQYPPTNFLEHTLWEIYVHGIWGSVWENGNKELKEAELDKGDNTDPGLSWELLT